MSVRFELQGSTALVTLDSPASRNAFTPELRDGLAQAIERVRAEREIRALILTGAGGHFCAGGDLRGIAAARLDGAGWRERMHGTQRWISELLTLDRPVIAAVDGAAYGAGFSLALAADFVLATPRARFCLSFMRLGLVPDCGVFYTLPRVVGAQRAKELMLSAREVGAPEAKDIGIVMELHAPERLLPRALALAASFADASPLATSLVKRTMSDPGALAALLDAEANAQALAFGSPEHQEAVRRFLDKQPLGFQWPA
ncbi:enoyl-CoA hydratase/isomerase family protein [Aquabacterium sp.]|uniref:enoyl-CoA hydratase/isomerase family protein n=1 Tax=Aquabacterium sp. TaxID=1872578 RepID=UPI002C91711B|nr:enoyl-CoA hydratase/isomerase family protein [Aquabacterium sp.]HSW04187.1 enoyl-CoA hydratase/isomerase family protein [Aquabacterium sp.]